MLSHLFPYLELERKLSNDSIKVKTVIVSGQFTRKKFNSKTLAKLLQVAIRLDPSNLNPKSHTYTHVA